MFALSERLNGKRAVVSGGNRGIGLEVCRQLVEQGCDVMLGSRDLELGQWSAQRVEARAVKLDVANPVSISKLFADIGDVDILINNAGIHYDTDQTALSVDWKVVEEAFTTNLFGAWRMAQAFAPGMRARRWGRIVNVSSEAGSLASMGCGTPAYSSSKAALNALTRVLAAELRGSGILVNAICPGWVATDLGGAGGRPVWQGAAGIVWAASLTDDGPTGGFFRDRRPLPW